MEGWMEGERAGARDAEGERWYIHSSSGIYSRPEERIARGAWLGLWLSRCLVWQRRREEGVGGERQLWRE